LRGHAERENLPENEERLGRVGIDIVSVAEVEASIETFGDRYVERVYGPREIAETGRAPERLAARFAAKEAFLKAVGAPDRGIDPRSVEVLRGASGAPSLSLSGEALATAKLAGLGAFELSLAHEGAYAIAIVIAEGPLGEGPLPEGLAEGARARRDRSSPSCRIRRRGTPRTSDTRRTRPRGPSWE
jgi:holo-[acyl-carrier protein] synthase